MPYDPMPPRAPDHLSSGLMLLFSVAVGVLISNLFVAQPLLAPIAASFGVGTAAAGLAVVLTQIGYALGLFLLLPLADLLENRGLVLRMLALAVAAMLAVALAPTFPLFLLASFLLGVASSAVQMIMTEASRLSAPERRGAVLGTLMSGIMIGLLLARPVGSLLAGMVGWRFIYVLSAAVTVVAALVMHRTVRRFQPPAGQRYGRLLGSLFGLLREEPVLRIRATYQVLLMAALSLFWTSIALRLAAPPLAMGATGIAVFALVGAGGAIVAPLAGRAGDRGWTRPATLVAHIVTLGGIALAGTVGAAGEWGWSLIDPASHPVLAVGVLGLAALAMDAGVVMDQALGRRAVNLLRPEARGRINGLFSGMFFLGSAAGSAVAGIAWQAGGWHGVCAAALIFAGAAFFVQLSRRS